MDIKFDEEDIDVSETKYEMYSRLTLTAVSCMRMETNGLNPECGRHFTMTVGLNFIFGWLA